MISEQLKERQKSILGYVIHQYIITATPVGSRNLSKNYDLDVSPATVRNIMADLEEFGYLGHPHTSAGRIPTDLGYRFYVDSLMHTPKLNKDDYDLIDSKFENTISETDEILKITSSILSNLTHQLACVSYPKFDNAVLEKIQLVSLSSSKLLVVISIRTGMIRTITLEITTGYEKGSLKKIESFLNQRLSGLTFTEIRNTITERVRSYSGSIKKPVIRVFLDSVEHIFKDAKTNEDTIITGTKNILDQPEFSTAENFKSIIELAEDKDIIIHIMDEKTSNHSGDVSVTIGSESNEEKLNDYSVVVKEYNIGPVIGNIGIIGPKRMEYSHTIASVTYMAELLSKVFKNKREG
ncbi:MAG: heat-inducible transcriptional repressor HrcA [Melioribacteraceae bacterium]